MESLITPVSEFYCFICFNSVCKDAYGPLISQLSDLTEVSTGLVSDTFIALDSNVGKNNESLNDPCAKTQFNETHFEAKPDREIFVRSILSSKDPAVESVCVKLFRTQPVCDNCSELIASVVRRKNDIDLLRRKVNDLKKELKETMNRLDMHLENYSVEMKSMERIVTNSDLERLKIFSNSMDSEVLREIHTVRGLILNAVHDVNALELTGKSKRPKRRRKRKLIPANSGNTKVAEVGLTADAMATNMRDFLMGTLIKEEPLDDEAFKIGSDEMGDLLGSHLLDDSDGFEPEVVNEVIGSSTGVPPEQDAVIVDGIEDLMDSSDEELLGSESEISSSCSEDNDLSSRGKELETKTKKRKEPFGKRDPPPDSKRSRKATYTKMLDRIDFGRMSKLKRKLVQRILHKKFRRPQRKPKTPGKEFVDDPRQSHFLEYDPTSDTLSLDGIPILIHESKNQDMEDVLSLSCSVCGYFASPAHNSRHPVDSFIYNHIAGQHLNLFQCVQCGSSLGGFKQYSDHILGHRMGFACDVCGRPLGGSQALARHKWSHLNDLEAAELVAKGLKDPREKKESSKLYPCATCGKVFPQRCQLKKHEKVHAQIRERITCEICGKQFLPSGFISHKRYYCFPEGAEQPRISCPLCPKIFKNKQFMQVHMDRAHKTERDHKCATCGKGFKTKKDLMTHEETHTTERAFSCKKGCGRTYKTRKNCNAHEKRCDGRGGVLIQRFLDAGEEERPFSCRKGCGRAYKTRRTLRGHEKNCTGQPFTGGGEAAGEDHGIVEEIHIQQHGDDGVDLNDMTVFGAALQASMEAVMEGGVIQTGVIIETETVGVPEVVVVTNETVASKQDGFIN